MNAILKYAGGKWRIADWIISHFPQHKVYCEPFFGSGGVFFNKEPVQIETINDLNGDIVNLFRICRERPDELATLINLTPFSRQEYIYCRQHTENDLERARRTFVRYWQSFGSADCSVNSWKNTQVASGPNNPKYWNNLPETVIQAFLRLKQVQIECLPAVDLIPKYDSADTLIYCDPPYTTDTRKGYLYKTEMKIQDHEELLSVLKASKSKIVLSGYDNELYNHELQDWFTAETETTAQMGLKRTEKLWLNYNPNKFVQETINFE